MDNSQTLVIVGNGIAAHAYLWTYAQMLKQGRLDGVRRISWLKSALVPVCSQSSTSLISVAGIERHVSFLGDTLLDAFEIFKHNFENYDCVQKAKQKHLPHGDLENFKRRYENIESDCFIIATKDFLNLLAKEIFDVLGEYIVEEEGTVMGWQKNELLLLGDQVLRFDHCVLAIGAGHALLKTPAKHKSVAGHYAWTNIDLGHESWVLSRGPHNLIYRAYDKTLLLGSYDDKDDGHGWPLMAKHGHSIKKILLDFENEISLPAKLNWQLESGVRHKAPKRQPFWGKLDEGIDSIHGLYKNGFTFSFLAAHQLLSRDRTIS